MQESNPNQQPPDKLNPENSLSSPDVEQSIDNDPQTKMVNDVGRPRALDITPELLNKVENYMAIGMNKHQVADCLGIGYRTLFDYSEQYPQFAQVLKVGKSKGIATAATKLFQLMQNQNLTAIIFYLKCQAGWKESEIIQIETKKPLIIELTPSGGNGNGHDTPVDNENEPEQD